MVKLSNLEVAYAPRPDATPEGELNALAAVYRFVLDSHTSKQGDPTTSRPDNAKGSVSNDRAKRIIPNR